MFERLYSPIITHLLSTCHQKAKTYLSNHSSRSGFYLNDFFLQTTITISHPALHSTKEIPLKEHQMSPLFLLCHYSNNNINCSSKNQTTYGSLKHSSLQYLQIIMSRGTLRPQAVSEVADTLSRLWPLLAPVHACVARYHPLLPVSQSCPLSEPPGRLLPH